MLVAPVAGRTRALPDCYSWITLEYGMLSWLLRVITGLVVRRWWSSSVVQEEEEVVSSRAGGGRECGEEGRL